MLRAILYYEPSEHLTLHDTVHGILTSFPKHNLHPCNPWAAHDLCPSLGSGDFLGAYPLRLVCGCVQGDLRGAPGCSLELVAADITQPATLLPEMFQGVRAAVLATAVKVSPKEGDNAQRDKYNQVISYALRSYPSSHPPPPAPPRARALHEENLTAYGCS